MANQQVADNTSNDPSSLDSSTTCDIKSDMSAEKPAKQLEGSGRNSMTLTAGIIVADVVGAGILGMPVAVSKFGWALGSFVLVVMLVANVHMSILMWRVRMAVPEPPSTYHEMCMVAFASAPAWQRRVAAVLGSGPQIIFIFMVLGIYLLSIGEGLGMLFYDMRLCLPVWTLFAACLLLPVVCMATEMGKYKSLVYFNVLALMGVIVIPLVYLAFSDEDVITEDSKVRSFNSPSTAGVMSGLSTFSFGLSSQFIVPEIMSEMRDPREFPKAYALLSAPFQLIAFLIAGVGGYCLIGDKVSGMIQENIPFGLCLRIASMCLAVHMIISYVIKSVIFTGFLQKVLDKKAADEKKSLRSMASWAGFASLTLVMAYLVANLVPFFNDAVDLLGASFTPLACWAMPIAMFVRTYKDIPGMPTVSKGEWLVLSLELVMALVIMVWGTYTSFLTIMAHWETYGYPFECHCQGLWDTCACSATHVGMDFCNATAFGH